MKKIVLLCAAGMSTSLLANKMQEAAKSENLQYEIAAHSLTEAERWVPDADVILLGPQVRFNLSRLRNQFPGKIIDVIDMTSYGMMDGKKIFEHAVELLK